MELTTSNLIWAVCDLSLASQHKALAAQTT
jgi:hypothetical protein